MQNSKQALEAKNQDKKEVEDLIEALQDKLRNSTDPDEKGAIESEVECAKQRLSLVMST